MGDRTWRGLLLACSALAGCVGSELEPPPGYHGFWASVGWHDGGGPWADTGSDVDTPPPPPVDAAAGCTDAADCADLAAVLRPCERVRCDVATAACEIVLQDDWTPCDDRNVCTTGDICRAGACVGSRPLRCDDQNPCTDDACHPTAGCRHEQNADPCNDGHTCTTGDVCAAGGCAGKPTPACFTGACCSQNGTPGCDDHPVNACVCSQEATCCDLEGAWDKACVALVESLGCGECPDPVCGDGLCGVEETCTSCADDCGVCAGCGDGLCAVAAGENCFNCVADCGGCAGEVCGDGECGESEDCLSCPNDCLEGCDKCNDGVCSAGEDCLVCPIDCGYCAGCGDGLCKDGENCFNCAVDCGECAGPVCGDGVCEDGESCLTCESDCGVCTEPVCGDASCDPASEDCVSCPADCAPCVTTCGDGACEPGETCISCPADCPCGPVCGDGSCAPTESCPSCPTDCGPCGPVCGDGWCDAGEDCTSCSPDCGPCTASDCCLEHLGPGCSDYAVESCVCLYDSYCCSSSWDSLCVEEVTDYGCGTCGGGPSAGNCCVESLMAGCGNAAIEACVCPFDSYCCETAWDGICVGHVTEYGCGYCF